MRKTWLIVAALAVAAVGAATVVEARGAWGVGRGAMMGRGGGPMMMGGGVPCQALTDGQISDAAVLERQQLALALAKADVEFWGKATAVEAENKAWIADRLAMAQQRLAALEAQVTN